MESECYDVVLEPILQELSGEIFQSGSNISPNAGLDLSYQSFWLALDKVFTDVNIFHMHKLYLMLKWIEQIRSQWVFNYQFQVSTAHICRCQNNVTYITSRP